jgi:hypothetical protein
MQGLTQALGHDNEGHNSETYERAENERQDEKNLVFIPAGGLSHRGLETMKPRWSASKG